MDSLPKKSEDFYSVYDRHRTYVRSEARKKHVRDFTRNVWIPGGFSKDMSVLEIGCGTGLFLSFLVRMGIDECLGIEQDGKVLDFATEEIARRIVIGDMNGWLAEADENRKFDRIVMLDVFEHLDPFEGAGLLASLTDRLKADGKVVMRVPNCSSPWGLQYQFHDLTHKSMYTPGSLRQVALSAGYDVERCVANRRGNKLKQVIERSFESLAARVITEPPPIWSANMVAVLVRQ